MRRNISQLLRNQAKDWPILSGLSFRPNSWLKHLSTIRVSFTLARTVKYTNNKRFEMGSHHSKEKKQITKGDKPQEKGAVEYKSTQEATEIRGTEAKANEDKATCEEKRQEKVIKENTAKEERKVEEAIEEVKQEGLLSHSVTSVIFSYLYARDLCRILLFNSLSSPSSISLLHSPHHLAILLLHSYTLRLVLFVVSYPLLASINTNHAIVEKAEHLSLILYIF